MNQLKETILNIIKDDDYDTDDLLQILSPISHYISNPIFIENVSQITKIILEDRDGNNKFTVHDLKLLQSDIVGVCSIVNALLLVLGALSETNVEYNSGKTEEMILKFLIYIFLIVIPKESNEPLTQEEKEVSLDLLLNIHKLIMSSKATQDLSNKISKLFKKNGWCKCICGEETKEDILNKKMPELQKELRENIIELKKKE